MVAIIATFASQGRPNALQAAIYTQVGCEYRRYIVAKT